MQLVYKAKKVSMIIDFWFSKSRAFLNTWFEFFNNTNIDFYCKDNLNYVAWESDFKFNCLEGYDRTNHYFNFIKQNKNNKK